MADVAPTQRIAALREQFATLAEHVDPAALEARAAELEQAMGVPGFWDDQESAAKVSAEHARVSRRLEQFRKLGAEMDDLDGLAELAVEDESIAGELDGQLAAMEQRLEELELERLFSGRYAAGDALVTVNAGA